MMTDHTRTAIESTVGAAPSAKGTTSIAADLSSAEKLAARHLATEHLLADLKVRTISGGFVTGLAQVAVFGLNLGSIVLLARLLTPQDFGLIAMVLTIMGFLRIFNDGGLSTATVQREGITHIQVSNLFWTNAALGGLAALLLAFSARVIAWFYREPRLVGITLALCLCFVFTSLAVQHWAILKRQMRFKMIALIQVSSVAAGVLVGVVMAWLNYRYWSLVGMQLTTPIVALLSVWAASRWRPQLPKMTSDTLPLLGFGANLSASYFLWSLARGCDGLLIGRYYGSASLGLYSRGAALVSRPVEQFMAPLEAVFVPVLSRLQLQPERYRRIVLQLYEVIAIVSFPLSAMLLALSHPITLLVLGPKWETAAPIFAAFTLIALYTPIAGITGWLLTSQCRGRHFLFQSMISSSLTIIAFLIGLPFGPVGVAMGYSAVSIFVFLPLLYYIAGRQGPVTTADLWGRFFIHLPLWVIVCGVTFLVHRLAINLSPLAQVIICGFSGCVAGIGFISAYSPARFAAVKLFGVLRDWKGSRSF